MAKGKNTKKSTIKPQDVDGVVEAQEESLEVEEKFSKKPKLEQTEKEVSTINFYLRSKEKKNKRKEDQKQKSLARSRFLSERNSLKEV